MIEECRSSLATLTILAPQLARARDQCRGIIAEIEATLTALSLGIEMEVESTEDERVCLAYERLNFSAWGLSARVYQRTPGATRALLSTTPLWSAPIATCLLLIPLLPLLLSALLKAATDTLAQLENTRAMPRDVAP